MDDEQQQTTGRAPPPLPQESALLDRPGPKGCWGRRLDGGPCRAPAVWERDQYGVKVRQTKLCFRHTLGDEGWMAAAAKGGRSKAAEDRWRRLTVPPERARELLRVVVAVVNESYSLRSAMERLTPFFARDDHEVELLFAELSKLKTFTERETEARVEAQSERIALLTEGTVY